MVSKFISCLISLMAFFSCADARDTITWLVVDWPPFMILEGEQKGEGLFDKVLALAQKNMPQYEHVNVKMNWTRFWTDVAEGQHVCNIFAIKTTEREKITEISEPHIYFVPNAIIMKKNTIEKLGNPKSYSLIELLKDNRFHGMIETTRSYSELDSILKNLTATNLVRKAAPPQSYIRMIAEDRIDYTLEYPKIAAYLDHENNPLPNQLSSVAIKELPAYTYGYTACPKNEWGKQVVEDWNQIFRQLKSTPEYFQVISTGVTDERELNLLRENYEYFQKLK
ncbi:MAG: TIGR02285 family protein [SAR324 cluster bacterium]|nr:TIGR02285 family protein [SAR324 cluster bacterium]